MVGLDAIREDFNKANLKPSLAWLEGLDLPTLNSRDESAHKFMCSDLQNSADGSLPDNILSLHNVVLPGCHLLQIQESVDIAQGDEMRRKRMSEVDNTSRRRQQQQPPQNKKRMLKLVLTDGKQMCFALEYRHINALNSETIKGTKIYLSGNPLIRRGFILLQEENISVAWRPELKWRDNNQTNQSENWLSSGTQQWAVSAVENVNGGNLGIGGDSLVRGNDEFKRELREVSPINNCLRLDDDFTNDLECLLDMDIDFDNCPGGMKFDEEEKAKKSECTVIDSNSFLDGPKKPVLMGLQDICPVDSTALQIYDLEDQKISMKMERKETESNIFYDLAYDSDESAQGESLRNTAKSFENTAVGLTKRNPFHSPLKVRKAIDLIEFNSTGFTGHDTPIFEVHAGTEVTENSFVTETSQTQVNAYQVDKLNHAFTSSNELWRGVAVTKTIDSSQVTASLAYDEEKVKEELIAQSLPQLKEEQKLFDEQKIANENLIPSLSQLHNKRGFYVADSPISISSISSSPQQRQQSNKAETFEHSLSQCESSKKSQGEEEFLSGLPNLTATVEISDDEISETNEKTKHLQPNEELFLDFTSSEDSD